MRHADHPPDIEGTSSLVSAAVVILPSISRTTFDREFAPSRTSVPSRAIRRGVVLICQGARKLNGIGTLLQPNDQPVLQCPHVSETSGEPLAGSSGTPRIAAESDDAFA